jgi:hypothetical protein
MEKTTKPEKSAPEKVKNRQNRSKIVEKLKKGSRKTSLLRSTVNPDRRLNSHMQSSDCRRN